MKKITLQDWNAMTEGERTKAVYGEIGCTPEEFQKSITETAQAAGGKKPNTVFLDVNVLAALPVKLRTVGGLHVIPMDAPRRDLFIISQVDPWEWPSIFYK